MDHYLLETINRTTEFIEERLLVEELCLDQIADHVNLTKFHLLRVWKGATATGLMEYVRRRRIAESLGDLLHKEHSIAYISAKYGFGCERSYSRVFKEEYGCTPARWRKKPVPLDILERFNSDFMNSLGEGLVFFRASRFLPSFSLAGPEYKVDTLEELPAGTTLRVGTDFFYNHRQSIISPVQRNIYYGFTAIPKSPCGHIVYQPSLQIDHGSIIPPEMSVRRIGPYKYIVFTYIGLHRPEEMPIQALLDAWNNTLEYSMPSAQPDRDERFSFEYLDYAKCSKQYCECDFYYPISLL